MAIPLYGYTGYTVRVCRRSDLWPNYVGQLKCMVLFNANGFTVYTSAFLVQCIQHSMILFTKHNYYTKDINLRSYFYYHPLNSTSVPNITPLNKVKCYVIAYYIRVYYIRQLITINKSRYSSFRSLLLHFH